jgi:multiple sugar transport system substrate-binding protein
MTRPNWLHRIGWALAIVAFGVLLLLDPSTVSQPEDGKIYIRYWYIVGANDDVMYHARAFNESQDSIVVISTPIPWQEHEKKILTAILSGNPPDVVSQFVPVVKWASRLALTPLDEFIERDALDREIFFPALWEEMQWQGKTFALPVNSASYAFFYNKRLFREAGLDPEGPPRTWDEVREFASVLTRRDERGRLAGAGFLPHYGNLHTAILRAWQEGARFTSDGGRRVNMTDPAVVRALEWCVELVGEQGLREVTSFVAGFGMGEQHGFLSEKVAMMVLDMSFLNQIELHRPDLDYGVAMIPSQPGYPTASSAGSWWLAIPRGARHVEAAWEFMRFATQTEIQVREVLNTPENLFPANRMAAHDPRFLRDEATEIFVRQMDYAHSPAVVPLAHDVFWREFYGAQERAIFGRQSAGDALRQAERVVQRALDTAVEYDDFVRTQIERERREVAHGR